MRLKLPWARGASPPLRPLFEEEEILGVARQRIIRPRGKLFDQLRQLVDAEEAKNGDEVT